MFAPARTLIARRSAAVRSMSSVTLVKTKKSALALTGVAATVLAFAPTQEFDDLDCQNHVNLCDDPDHPCHTEIGH